MFYDRDVRIGFDASELLGQLAEFDVDALKSLEGVFERALDCAGGKISDLPLEIALGEFVSAAYTGSANKILVRLRLPIGVENMAAA